MKCAYPITITDRKSGLKKPASCGHCAACVKLRTGAWVARCMLELQSHTQSCWTTLTYDENPGSLRYVDVQRFLQRLRRSTPALIRYCVVGEHGTRYGRPHWHMIVYGHQFEKGLSHIEQWPHGGVMTKEVAPATIAYTCKYQLRNRYTGEQTHVFHTSKGIGFEWCIEHGRLLHRLGYRQITKAVNINGTSHYLGRTAVAKIRDSFVAAGGEPLEEERSVLSYDLESRILERIPISSGATEGGLEHGTTF